MVTEGPIGQGLVAERSEGDNGEGDVVKDLRRRLP
jgi:hypothetical protein